jgi:hypothetical protein
MGAGLTGNRIINQVKPGNVFILAAVACVGTGLAMNAKAQAYDSFTGEAAGITMSSGVLTSNSGPQIDGGAQGVLTIYLESGGSIITFAPGTSTLNLNDGFILRANGINILNDPLSNSPNNERLTIVEPAVPEPTTLSLFGLSAMALLKRRPKK